MPHSRGLFPDIFCYCTPPGCGDGRSSTLQKHKTDCITLTRHSIIRTITSTEDPIGSRRIMLAAHRQSTSDRPFPSLYSTGCCWLLPPRPHPFLPQITAEEKGRNFSAKWMMRAARAPNTGDGWLAGRHLAGRFDNYLFFFLRRRCFGQAGQPSCPIKHTRTSFLLDLLMHAYKTPLLMILHMSPRIPCTRNMYCRSARSRACSTVVVTWRGTRCMKYGVGGGRFSPLYVECGMGASDTVGVETWGRFHVVWKSRSALADLSCSC